MIEIKSEKEINSMKEGGKILAEIMAKIKNEVSPGKKTIELNRLAEGLLFKYGRPSFKGYQSFPAAICVSLNEEIVHGLPSQRTIQEGDIVSLDLGFFYKGFHTDMAITVPVGKVDYEILKMIKVTKKALEIGIEKAKEGNTFGDVGEVIQRYVESQNFTIIKNFCGHGIGREIHEEPQILNFKGEEVGPRIEKGMVFCIEPIIGCGSGKSKKGKDGFAYKTEDGSFSAHFEHTIAVTENGTEVLTR